MTFNTASHFKPFVFVDEMCEIHNVKKYLVQVTNKTACRLCVQEEILAREQQLAKEKYKQHIIATRDRYLYTFPDVNEELRNASFPSYVPQTKEEADVKRSAMRIAKAYIDGANNNTIFSGDSGTGKSHLAYAIIKNYAHKTNKLATIINFPDLLNRMKQDLKNNDYSYLDKIIEMDLLVLDDIGAEKQTDWTDEILYRILDKRSRTIITTNLTGQELQKRYDKRTVSRLLKGVTQDFIVEFNNIKDKRGKLFNDR